MKKNIYFFIALFLCLSALGCKKYLDAKSSKAYSTISSLADAQALLDYYPHVNNYSSSAGEASADNYYLSYADFLSLSSDYLRNCYTWQDPAMNPNSINDWMQIYDLVYIANTVLNCLNTIEQTSDNISTWKDVEGQAYFYRARAYLEGAWVWCPAYDSASAASDLGMVLRLDPDFNETSVRATNQETYQQIIADLKKADQLLPSTTIHKLRPCKGAAYALMARTYLSMRNYSQVLLYADSALQQNSYLMDFNNTSLVVASASYPIPKYNNEIYADSRFSNSLLPGKTDSTLYKSYSTYDLRKTVFFKSNTDGSHSFKGSYSHSSVLNSSVTVDEVYLMRAEAKCRLGDIDGALADLNKLLLFRYKTGYFTPYSGLSQSEALTLILNERRKELLMRGLRWIDIKRLNKEGYKISLTRSEGNNTYSLPPDNLHFQLLIPSNIILLTNGSIKQNPR